MGYWFLSRRVIGGEGLVLESSTEEEDSVEDEDGDLFSIEGEVIRSFLRLEFLTNCKPLLSILSLSENRSSLEDRRGLILETLVIVDSLCLEKER